MLSTPVEAVSQSHVSAPPFAPRLPANSQFLIVTLLATVDSSVLDDTSTAPPMPCDQAAVIALLVKCEFSMIACRALSTATIAKATALPAFRAVGWLPANELLAKTEAVTKTESCNDKSPAR